MRFRKVTVFIFLFIILGVIEGRWIPRMERSLTNSHAGCQRGMIWRKSERKCVKRCNPEKGRFWSRFRGKCVPVIHG